MSRVTSRLGVVSILAAGLACTARPLVDGTDAGMQPQPQDAVDDIQRRSDTQDVAAGGDVPARDAVADDPTRDITSGTDAQADAGAVPDAPSEPRPRPRLLSLVLDGAPWYATQATQGIAVDARGRVYVGDYATVFEVEGATVGKYLTPPEVGATGFGDLDIAPDGRLYIVASWPTPGRFGVIRSSKAHEAEAWLDLSPTLTDLAKMAVIDDGTIGVISRAGLWTFTGAGGALVYEKSRLVTTDSCANQDLAAARSGVFLYQPGCNGSPLLRGRADGSGVAIIYKSAIGSPSEVQAANFKCSGRDPSGGFYFVVDDINDGTLRLYHLAEDAQGTSGLTWIETVPSFAEAEKQKSSTFGFEFCSLATGTDGTVFFQTYAQLWKVSPPE